MKGRGDPADYSPPDYISNKLPPTIIIQGKKDILTLTKDAKAFKRAAERAGATCKLFIYPRVGHVLTRNLKVQDRDFDFDFVKIADAEKREFDFLQSPGYIK